MENGIFFPYLQWLLQLYYRDWYANKTFSGGDTHYERYKLLYGDLEINLVVPPIAAPYADYSAF